VLIASGPRSKRRSCSVGLPWRPRRFGHAARARLFSTMKFWPSRCCSRSATSRDRVGRRAGGKACRSLAAFGWHHRAGRRDGAAGAKALRIIALRRRRDARQIARWLRPLHSGSARISSSRKRRERHDRKPTRSPRPSPTATRSAFRSAAAGDQHAAVLQDAYDPFGYRADHHAHHAAERADGSGQPGGEQRRRAGPLIKRIRANSISARSATARSHIWHGGDRAEDNAKLVHVLRLLAAGDDGVIAATCRWR